MPALLLLTILAAFHTAFAQRATSATQQKYHTHYAPKPDIVAPGEASRHATTTAPK